MKELKEQQYKDQNQGKSPDSSVNLNDMGQDQAVANYARNATNNGKGIYGDYQ